MTEYKAPHRAEPEVWAAVERWGKNDMDAANCILELRARVEALEAAQRPTVKESLTVPADLVEQVSHLGPVDVSLAGRQPWAAMSYRGVMLLPPIDCADPDSWIAERIYEMGLADGKSATTGNSAPVTRDHAEDAPAPSDSLVERVAYAIIMNAFGGVCEQARAAILAAADWFEQQGSHATAARLRQEAQ